MNFGHGIQSNVNTWNEEHAKNRDQLVQMSIKINSWETEHIFVYH